jgi:uncharacterized C2H2 Zn-finger protein
MADFKCPDCGRTFDKAQGLGAHRARVHGYRASKSNGRAAVTRREVRSFDSDAMLRLVFPDGIPARVGIIERANGLLGSARDLHDLARRR